MRSAAGVEWKEVYSAIGMKQSAWSRKMMDKESRFSLEELGAVADFFSQRVGKPLTGWPLVDVEVSDIVDRPRSS